MTGTNPSDYVYNVPQYYYTPPQYHTIVKNTKSAEDNIVTLISGLHRLLDEHGYDGNNLYKDDISKLIPNLIKLIDIEIKAQIAIFEGT